MNKYKNILLPLVAVIVSLMAGLIYNPVTNAADPSFRPSDFNWNSSGEFIGGKLKTSEAAPAYDIKLTGKPPTYEATLNRYVYGSISQIETGGTAGGLLCSAKITLTMASPTKGKMTANVTSGNKTDCPKPVTGEITVGSANNAPQSTAWTTAAPTTGNDGGEEESEEQSTCVIDGVGWIVCPVVSFFAEVIDGLYAQLEKLFLQTEPLSTDTKSPTYVVWSQMRNIANLAFVVAFLIIVFSHISSIGLNNYNIKKMLPRLIIAAILVNISYWLCALAIDASNIVGSHSKAIFTDAIKIPGFGPEEGPWYNSGFWSALVVLVIAGGTGALLGFSVFLPVLIAALAALVTVVAVLLMREALIILLVVVSPLAFVAFLLPNTEDLFSKWRKLLTTMLLMYPVIGAIFGASQLASKIVMASDNADTLTKIMGAGISVIPLFITPVVMRAAGGVLNRFAGIVNDKDKGVFDRMRKGAGSVRERETAGMNLRSAKRAGRAGKYNPTKYVSRGAFARRKAANEEEKRSLDRSLNKETAGYVSDKVKNDEKYRNKIAGGSNFQNLVGRTIYGSDSQIGKADDDAMTSALANAINVEAKIEAEEVQASRALIEEASLDAGSLQQIARGNENVKFTDTEGVDWNFSGANNATRSAAIEMAMSKSTPAEVEQLVMTSNTMSKGQRDRLVDGINKNGHSTKLPYVSGKFLDDLGQGRISSEDDLDQAVVTYMEKGKFSADKLVGADSVGLARMQKVANSGNLSTKAAGNLDKLREKAAQTLNDPLIAKFVVENQVDHLKALQGNATWPPPAQTNSQPNQPTSGSSGTGNSGPTPQPQSQPFPQSNYVPNSQPNNQPIPVQSQSSSGSDQGRFDIDHNTPPQQEQPPKAQPQPQMQPFSQPQPQQQPQAQPSIDVFQTNNSYANNFNTSNYQPQVFREQQTRTSAPAGSGQFSAKSAGGIDISQQLADELRNTRTNPPSAPPSPPPLNP